MTVASQDNTILLSTCSIHSVTLVIKCTQTILTQFWPIRLQHLQVISNSYNMDTRALAHLLHKGHKWVKRLSVHVITGLLQFIAELSFPCLYIERTRLTLLSILVRTMFWPSVSEMPIKAFSECNQSPPKLWALWFMISAGSHDWFIKTPGWEAIPTEYNSLAADGSPMPHVHTTAKH